MMMWLILFLFLVKTVSGFDLIETEINHSGGHTKTHLGQFFYTKKITFHTEIL